MPSIWDFCKKVETIENENTEYVYHKAKLDIALKEIKTKNLQEKLVLFNKIENIKKLDIIKIYDYFDENDTIFILLEDDKKKYLTSIKFYLMKKKISTKKYL